MTRIIRRTPPQGPSSETSGTSKAIHKNREQFSVEKVAAAISAKLNPSDLCVPPEIAEANIRKVLTQKTIVEQVEDEGSSKVDYPGVIARYMEKITNRGTAIRAFCVGCSGGQLSEVRDCQVKKCALYPYRMGTDPGNLKTQKRLAAQQAEEDSDGS